MGLFDKLKNVFMEDDIDEEPVRSVPKVEEIKKEEPVIQKRERELPVEDTFSDRELVNSKENFKFPIIFDLSVPITLMPRLFLVISLLRTVIALQLTVDWQTAIITIFCVIFLMQSMLITASI